MDQLRKIVRWLKQQHFWVLSVLVAVIGLFCWWCASGTLSTEFKANQTAIAGVFNNLKSLKDKTFHPNGDIQKEQIKQTKLQAEHVKATWQQLYDRQRENVLEWPAALSQEFRDYVEGKNFGDEIPPDLRDNYLNYVLRHFPKLPEKVGARIMQPGEAGYSGGEGAFTGGYSRGGEYSRGGGYPGEGSVIDPLLGQQDDYICEWNDQNLVREELNFPQRPSSTKIWVTQENLWVYHTLLQAIANTNKAAGATRMSNAAVRIIYSLEVGRRAAGSSRGKGRIYMLPSAAPDPTMIAEGGMATDPMAAGGGYSERGAESPYGAYGGGESAFDFRGEGGYGGTAATPEQERSMLLNGRYLDADGKPIVAGGGMADPAMVDPAMAADPAAAAAPSPSEFGTEYKQLPVRMTLKMDQRWLTRLLSECANQPLQVEVQEVRINPQGGLGGEGGSGYGGGVFGGSGRGYDGGGGTANMFPEPTGLQTFTAQPNIVDVVIQGVIYIFNEPNPDVLKTPGEDEEESLAMTQQ